MSGKMSNIDLEKEPYKAIMKCIKSNGHQNFIGIAGMTGLPYHVVVITLSELIKNDHIAIIKDGYQLKAVVKP